MKTKIALIPSKEYNQGMGKENISGNEKSSRGNSVTSRRRHQRNVLAVVALNVFAGQRKLAGITRFFNERLPREEDKWSIDVIHGNDALTEAALRRAVRSGVSGIILLDYPSAATMRIIARSKIPCVVEISASEDVDSNIIEPVGSGGRIVRIICESRSIAREASANLAVQQIFKSFCYVGTPEGESWSLERGHLFGEALAERGLKCQFFTKRWKQLGIWLSSLPRPAAICAANDATARDVINAALAANLRIPADMAVLGIDDDPKFCLGASPTLSSVVQDFDACGFLAAEALQQMMDGDYSGPKILHYGAKGVAIRESTMHSSPYADFVQRALDWIDANACRYISATDVARALDVSRRTLDLRLSEVLQTTVHVVLRERRLEQVKRLLETSGMTIAQITESCGFTSAGHLKNLFRKTFGCSMRDWRNRNRSHASIQQAAARGGR